MNKKEVFESFKSRIEEIVNHYDEVEEIKFYALLKNGTRFKDDSYPISFLLISIVDGLVVQSLLKTEKLPYGEISRFLIDKLK